MHVHCFERLGDETHKYAGQGYHAPTEKLGSGFGASLELHRHGRQIGRIRGKQRQCGRCRGFSRASSVTMTGRTPQIKVTTVTPSPGQRSSSERNWRESGEREGEKSWLVCLEVSASSLVYYPAISAARRTHFLARQSGVTSLKQGTGSRRRHRVPSPVSRSWPLRILSVVFPEPSTEME